MQSALLFLTQLNIHGLPKAQLQSVFDAIVYFLVYFMQHPLGEAILVQEK